MKRSLVAGTAAVLLAVGSAAGKDVYKAFLSPEVPHHRAIKEILAQIDANPLDASLFNDLGCLVAWDGFWRDALRNFETAAKLDKGDTRPVYNSGIVYAYKGEWGNAKSAFSKAVKRGPGNWAGWWMLGYAEEQLGNQAAAIDAYKTSLRMDTSLFDVKKNPFAANSRLKTIALTATYDKRLVRAAMPKAEEFADMDRIAALLQPIRISPRGAALLSPEAAAPPAATGPVITTIPPPSSVAPRPAAGPMPSQYRARPAAPREAAPPAPTPTPDAPEPSPPAPQTAPGVPPPAVPTTIVPGPGAGA
jgi:hypothetical protein